MIWVTLYGTRLPSGHPQPSKGEAMSDHTYGISEIVGTSNTSVDDAISGAVTKASKTLRNLDWFEVSNIRGHIRDGAVGHYQVTLKIGFRID